MTEAQVIDSTEMDPSWGGAAGQLIPPPAIWRSSPPRSSSGELLPAAQLAEMQKTIDAPVFPG